MTPQEAIEKHELSIKAVFVPFSQSRNKDEKNKSLNWKITLLKNDKEILTTDYSAGIGHCPAYNAKGVSPIGKLLLTKAEIESGHVCRTNEGYIGFCSPIRDLPILPNTTDVIYALFTDSDVLNYGSFEEWASAFGYDADSRKDEKTYRACLDIALKLRSWLGDKVLMELQEAFQDY